MSFTTMRLTACLATAAAGFMLTSVAQAATFSEGFDTGVPAGWAQQNNSTPTGASTWVQGATALGPAHSGGATSFVVVNFNSTTGAGAISNWLWTPTMTVNPDSVLSFYTRVGANPANYPDRLEVRWSDATTASPGTGASSVGTFTALLVSVNPSLSPSGYPAEWTEYTYSFSGLTSPSTGNIGFRYFVDNGGPLGTNSDIIGIDTMSVTNTGVVPEPASYLLLALGIGALALRRQRSSGG